MNEMMPYILEQPTLLRSMLADRAALAAPFVQALAAQPTGHLVLVASGTSRNAACAAAPFLQWALKTPVSVEAPSVLDEVYGTDPMLVFISQGGNSTNTIAAIRSHSGVRSLALTGDPNGEIAHVCDHAVLIPCGEEKAGPKTKGYTTTILMLYLMALEASQTLHTLTAGEYAEAIGRLQTAADQMPENIDRVKAWAAANQTTLRNMQVAYLVGKKQAAAVAAEGALKLLETILIPAQAFDFEEFLHGSSCSIDSHIAGFYMLPDTQDRDYERMQRLVTYHREQSAPVYTIGTEPGSDARDLCLLRSGAWYTQPFELILPLQIIANDLPGVLGLDGVGHERFWVLDKKLGIKAKFEG